MSNGFRYPDRFRAVGAFSPLTTQLRKNYRENPEVPAYLEKYEPLLLIQKAMKRGEMPDLYYCYGTEDFLYDMQDWFKEKLEENEVKCTIEVLPDYGHEWAFWDREVKAFLDWIPRTDPYYKEASIRRI